MTSTEYLESYERLARDHVAHWRATGSNPFMPDADVQRFNEATVEALRRHVPAGAVVLDAGCGMGAVLGETPEYERHGIDIAPEYLEIARERGLNAVYGEIGSMPYADDSFDAVLALDVLEHVFDLYGTTKELLRVLRPGGVLIARSPDSEDMAGYVDYDLYYSHVRRLDDPSLRLLFGRIFGCEIVETQVVGSEILAVARKP